MGRHKSNNPKEKIYILCGKVFVWKNGKKVISGKIRLCNFVKLTVAHYKENMGIPGMKLTRFGEDLLRRLHILHVCQEKLRTKYYYKLLLIFKQWWQKEYSRIPPSISKLNGHRYLPYQKVKTISLGNLCYKVDSIQHFLYCGNTYDFWISFPTSADDLDEFIIFGYNMVYWIW